MNQNPPAYTPLEAFALFQELKRNFQNGLVIGTFSRVSETLKKTPLIFEQDDFDADRLSPESLQGFALQLLREERKEERRREAEAAAEKNNAGLSPNSRKRKLQSPPLSTFQEALEQTDKLPNLVEKLYIRFRDNLIREIREDERRFDELQRELAEIERGEWDNRLVQEQRTESPASNGFPAANDPLPARPEGQAAPTPTPIPPVQIQAHTPTPTPTPISVQAPTISSASTLTAISTSVPVPPQTHDHSRKTEPPHTPQPPQERKVVHSIPPSLPPPTRPPSEARHIAPDNRPQELGRPIGNTTPVLQHPQTVQGYPARSGSATPQPPVVDGLQRPEGVPKGRSPAPIQTNQPQPHTPNPTPAPALKWEPPYQPPHQSSPQPPFPPSYQPPPPPLQHQPTHQTPVPSPRPPYSTGVTRPPTYPQTPTSLPQLPQNYAGGRQTPGQYGQVSRPSTQGSAPASPSVLLPPQSAGQIPPSLQSLPLNATPDGAGQQVPQRRPASIPTVSSPGSNIGPGPFAQHQSSHVPTQTPVRPPAALSEPHPAASPPKPPVPPTQWSPAPGPARPSHPPQTPVQAPSAPPTSQQGQSASISYSSPYNQQAQPAQQAGAIDSTQRPQVPPLQTPVAVPQPTRPLSANQVHTPVAVSPHIIRGHGTKWTSTPTPATPRVDDVTGYFDIQSPVYEPISPRPQSAQLPKTSPEQNGKKDIRKTLQKPDVTPNRPRGRPRITQKPSSAQSEEALVDPDLSGSNIKNEEATPQALEDIGHATTADESGAIRDQPGPSQLSNKRKRQESPPNRAPPTPATHVLWTRSFNKISQSALDQIISHRHANMFAHPVKPKTAPGYFEIVLRPQDLKGIQKAITAGSKAASIAVATMPDIDPSATNVWLPMSVDLVPPRGIINIAQLERELVHMFANAIMYNPDPYRGFGPSFLKSNRRASLEGDGEDYRGYEVDENGVVKDTRSMFGEVEKLLSDLRNEVERNAPPPTGVPPSASRSMSVAGGEMNTTEDDADEPAGDTSKRRRIRG
ncbi:hypothetical protein GL218_00384 [Daldinia childiae]|uniref:uncharacterized protein n=1 Tax=Daldinia childiae TaxID=326645 RepID=UPI001447A83B|nr:uncharacterized protein GL218_00384 [Daldinia childiae]KAF3071028.1 hypothetical protein GL218_00384 [Daldinia childiae]